MERRMTSPEPVSGGGRPSRHVRGLAARTSSSGNWLPLMAWPTALIAICCATLAPGFSMSRVFYYRDLIVYLYPMQRLAQNMLLRGEFPLWNPYNGFGTPFAAMADVMLYYPITWITWIIPHPLGFNLGLTIHCCIAAIAT